MRIVVFEVKSVETGPADSSLTTTTYVSQEEFGHDNKVMVLVQVGSGGDGGFGQYSGLSRSSGASRYTVSMESARRLAKDINLTPIGQNSKQIELHVVEEGDDLKTYETVSSFGSQTMVLLSQKTGLMRNKLTYTAFMREGSQRPHHAGGSSRRSGHSRLSV